MAGPTSDERTPPGLDAPSPATAATAWAASGASALSGPPPGGLLGPPERLVGGVTARGARIRTVAASWGRSVDLDWLGLLGERAALDGLTARGRTSCGGASRLLRCADGWLALSLARPSDVELLPAWLVLAGDPDPFALPGPTDGATDGVMGERWRAPDAVWHGIEDRTRHRPAAALAEAAAVVALPVGVLGERMAGRDGGVAVHRFAGSADTGPPRRVIDLSSLWAGPLCASLFAACGAEVVKVGDRRRPDGARSGNPDWYRLLNGDKAHVELALDTAAGRAELAEFVAGADVVVESARPRALEQMGIVAAEVLAAPGGPRAWISITGHGRRSSRVAFGDDAAVSGGLVVHDDDGPWFCGDAIADPLSGLAATDAAMSYLAAGARGLVEVSMSDVAAAHAGATLPARGPVASPRARTTEPFAVRRVPQSTDVVTA